MSSLRSALMEAGQAANKYVGHNFRIGAASTASRCGLQDALIKTLGNGRVQHIRATVPLKGNVALAHNISSSIRILSLE